VKSVHRPVKLSGHETDELSGQRAPAGIRG